MTQRPPYRIGEVRAYLARRRVEMRRMRAAAAAVRRR